MDPLKASANRELGGERPSFPYQMRAHPPAEPLQPSNTSNSQISNLTESTMTNLAPAVGQFFDQACMRAPEELQMKPSQETTASDSTIMASPVDPSLSNHNFQSGSSDLQHHRSDGMRVLTPSSAAKVSVASGAAGTNLNVVQGSFSSNELASTAAAFDGMHLHEGQHAHPRKILPPYHGAGNGPQPPERLHAWGDLQQAHDDPAGGWGEEAEDAPANSRADLDDFLYQQVGTPSDDDQVSIASGNTDARVSQADALVTKFRLSYPDLYNSLMIRMPEGGLLLAAQRLKTRSGTHSTPTLAPISAVGDEAAVTALKKDIPKLQIDSKVMREIFQMKNGIFSHDMWSYLSKLFFEQTGHHTADLLQQSPLGFIASKGVTLGFSFNSTPSSDIINTVEFGFSLDRAPETRNAAERVKAQNQAVPAFLYTQTQIADEASIKLMHRFFGYPAQLQTLREGGHCVDTSLLRNARLLHVLNLRFLDALLQIMEAQILPTRYSSSLADVLSRRLDPVSSTPVHSLYMPPDILTYVLSASNLQVCDAHGIWQLIKSEFPRETGLDARLIRTTYGIEPTPGEGLGTFSKRFVQTISDIQTEIGATGAMANGEMTKLLMSQLFQCNYKSRAEDSERHLFLTQIRGEVQSGSLRTPHDINLRIQRMINQTQRFQDGPEYQPPSTKKLQSSSTVHAYPVSSNSKPQGGTGGKGHRPTGGNSGGKGGSSVNTSGSRPREGAGGGASSVDGNQRNSFNDDPLYYRTQSILLTRLKMQAHKEGRAEPREIADMQFIPDPFSPEAKKDKHGRPYPLLRVFIDPTSGRIRRNTTDELRPVHKFLRELGGEDAVGAFQHLFKVANSSTSIGGSIRACKPLPPRNGAGAPAGAASHHSAPRAGAPAGSANHRTSPRPTSAPIASGPVKVFTVSLNPAQLQLLQAHGLSPNETGVESVEVEWEGWESEPDTTRSTVGAEQEGGGHFPTSM